MRYQRPAITIVQQPVLPPQPNVIHYFGRKKGEYCMACDTPAAALSKYPGSPWWAPQRLCWAHLRYRLKAAMAPFRPADLTLFPGWEVRAWQDRDRICEQIVIEVWPAPAAADLVALLDTAQRLWFPF